MTATDRRNRFMVALAHLQRVIRDGGLWDETCYAAMVAALAEHDALWECIGLAEAHFFDCPKDGTLAESEFHRHVTALREATEWE